MPIGWLKKEKKKIIVCCSFQIKRPSYLLEEESEQQLRILYDAYLEEETSVLRTLGLKTEETDLPEK